PVVLAVPGVAAVRGVEADLEPVLAVEEADGLGLRGRDREREAALAARLEGHGGGAERRQQPPGRAGQRGVEHEEALHVLAVDALGLRKSGPGAGVGLEPRRDEDVVEVARMDAYERGLHLVHHLRLAAELPELLPLRRG